MSLKVENLSIRRGGVEIVSGVTFGIEPGEVIGIIGESGVGKTALLRAILGLERDSHGIISALGKEVSLPTPTMGSKMLGVRSFLGIFFGPESLRPYETIGDRIRRLAAGNENTPTGESSVGSLIERLGLSGLLERYPHELSMGQKARAGVLACLASNRHIILLDEFGSNLDDRTQRDLFTAARDVATLGRAIGIVSHSRSLLQTIATRMYELKERRLQRV